MSRQFILLAAILLCFVGIRAAAPSGSLPVLYINTANSAPITSKTDYVQGTYYLDPMGAVTVAAIGSQAEPLPLQIRGRGNYTWSSFDKKPYRLKLDKKQPLMGMNKSKHWALLAHADDNQGFLRNAVGFRLSQLAGLPWTPGVEPLEVVLNGDYIGLYFLTETVRVATDRVNVWNYDDAYEEYAEANPGQTLPWDDEYATGGWLLEIDNTEDDDQYCFQSQDPYVPDPLMRIKYDTPSDYITEAHLAWLGNELHTLDDLIVNGDKSACRWAEKIDLTNLARFFVVNQLVFNYEAFHGSCKFSREKGYDTKWNFGPVWDFGSAFQSIDNVLFFDYGPYSNHWIKAMYQYPAFVAEVERVYAELMDGGYDSLDAYIDEFIAHITDAARADKERWPQYGNDNLPERAARVKKLLSTSKAFLDYTWHYTDSPYDVIPPSSDLYLRGEITDWEARIEYRFEDNGNGIFVLTVPHLEGEFKIAGPEWDAGNVDFGGQSDIKLDTPVTLLPGGSNCSLAEPADNVTLTLDWNTKQLTISHNNVPPVKRDNYVYFIDTNDWEHVNVFTWDPVVCGEWPGTAMTKADPAELGMPVDTHLWKYVFADNNAPEHGASGIIFNNGRSGAGNQTADLIYMRGGIYDMDGTVSIDKVGEDAANTTVYYNLQGIPVAEPSAAGIYIVRRGSRVSKVLIN